MDDNFRARSNQSLQENLERTEPAIAAAYRVIGAILGLGGLGYLLDRWMDTAPWLLVAGLSLGVVVGLTGLVRAVRPS